MKPEHKAKIDEAIAKITIALDILYDLEIETKGGEQYLISNAIAKLTDAGRCVEKIK